MLHALSVDVEDWYHDSAVAPGAVGPRVERNTDLLLEIFAEIGARATFFVLGEVAQQFPQLVRRIAEAGHELGSHSFHHRKVIDLTRAEFREDVARSLRVIEDCAGRAVQGFRAPYFSIPADVRWPIDILAESGLRYDASIPCIARPPGLELVTPRRPYRLHNGLWEVPVGFLRLGPFWHLPLASGAGLRFFSSATIAKLTRRFEREEGAAVFYLHPWEIDPDSPAGEGAGRWFLRVGRNRLERRLRELARSVSFASIAEVLPAPLG